MGEIAALRGAPNDSGEARIKARRAGLSPPFTTDDLVRLSSFLEMPALGSWSFSEVAKRLMMMSWSDASTLQRSATESPLAE